MMLAQRWSGQAVGGWWLAEKFDGVRAFWDGAALRTRTWRAIAAPEWFTVGLPRGVALDGELWGGRGTFQIASELSRFERAADPAWRGMRLMLFDWPTTAAIPIEERANKLAGFENEFAQVVKLRRCEGAEDARRSLAEMTAHGGEGLVLKRPGSFYHFGRSRDWLKVKPEGID